MVVKATQGGPAADTLPWQKDRGPAEPVVDGEGGALPPSLSFRFCPGCARPYFSDLLGCGRCLARLVHHPKCDIAYCVDCGAVLRRPWAKRCRVHADVMNYLTKVVPNILQFIERREREESWRAVLREEFIDTRRRLGPVRPTTTPVLHPCHVPGCGRERLYSASACSRHDEDLNGPLPLLWATGNKRVSAAWCLTCRIPSDNFFCPYHRGRNPLVIRRTVYGTVSVECPVCFARPSGDNETKAWFMYAEHHRRKHPQVLLVEVEAA